MFTGPPGDYFKKNPGSQCTTIKDTHIELLESANEFFVLQYISNLRYNSRASRGGKELWHSEDPRQSRDAAEAKKFIEVLLKKLEWDPAFVVASEDGLVTDVWDWLYGTWILPKHYTDTLEAITKHIEYYEGRGKDVVPFSFSFYYSNNVGPGSWKNTPEQRCIPWHYESDDNEGMWYSTGKEKIHMPSV